MASEASRTPELLSIGIDVGGPNPANHLIREGLASVRKQVMARRAEFPNTGLRINIVFQVPGNLFQPDYEGVAASRFVRKDNHLLINAAVPATLRFDEVPRFFRATLLAVKDEARRYLANRRITVDDNAVMKLIDALLDGREHPAR